MSVIQAENLSSEDIVLEDLSVPDSILPGKEELVELTQWNTVSEIRDSAELIGLVAAGKVQLYVDEQPLVHVNDMFSPPVIQVFGQEILHLLDEREHKTADTRFQTLIKDSIGSVAGKYFIQWNIEAAAQAFKWGAFIRLQVADGEMLDRKVYAVGNRKTVYESVSGGDVVKLNELNTLSLAYAAQRRGKTVYVRNVRIIAWRIA